MGAAPGDRGRGRGAQARRAGDQLRGRDLVARARRDGVRDQRRLRRRLPRQLRVARRSSRCATTRPIRTNPKKRNGYWWTASRFLAELEAAGGGRHRGGAPHGGDDRLAQGRDPGVRDRVRPRGRALDRRHDRSRSPTARSFWRKSSYLVGKEGELIASPLVTDRRRSADPARARLAAVRRRRPADPQEPGGRARRAVPGAVRRRTARASSAAQSTGAAGRGVGGNPGPTTSNLIMQAGAMTRQDLLRTTPSGLYVTNLMGFGFNPVTGDFSRGAQGFWIENGELTFPVSEVTIAANFDEILKRIDAVADDLELRSVDSSADVSRIAHDTRRARRTARHRGPTCPNSLRLWSVLVDSHGPDETLCGVPAVATAGGLPTRLGKYEILTPARRRVGWRRIYIGRSTGIGSFERHVVLKMILPERAHDETVGADVPRRGAARGVAATTRTSRRCSRSARTAASTTSRWSTSTARTCARCSPRPGASGTRVPLELALTVVAGAAAGLHHAHERRGPRRRAAGHRPPRRVAVEHHGRLRRLGEAARLRHREGDGALGRDPERHHQGQVRVHVARAVPRPRRRSRAATCSRSASSSTRSRPSIAASAPTATSTPCTASSPATSCGRPGWCRAIRRRSRRS